MSNLTKLIVLLVIGILIAGCSIYLIGGKKQPYDAELIIKAPIGQIFPYVVQPELKKRWMKGLVDQKLIDADAVDEGVSLRSTRIIGGETEQFEDRVIRYQANEIISTRARNNRLSSTIMIRLKEEGSGTRVTYRRVVRFYGIDRFKTVFSESEFQQELERDLEELAKLIERNVSSPDENAIGGTNADETSEPANANQNSAEPETASGG